MANDPVEVVHFLLETAITLGAPAFNSGDHRGCFEIYACTARLILNTIKEIPEEARILRKALEKTCILCPVDEQAWTMRLAFDSILKTGEGSDTDDSIDESSFN